MSALVRGKLVSFLVDIGAEVSLAPMQVAKLGDRQSLSHPFDVKLFDDAIRDRVTESAILRMDFNGTELGGEFFVANVDFPIKDEEIKTSPSIGEAKMYFQLHQDEGHNINTKTV